jgi:hypothetical protein
LTTASITTLCAQTQTNKFFESVAKQHFQKIYFGALILKTQKVKAALRAAFTFWVLSSLCMRK